MTLHTHLSNFNSNTPPMLMRPTFRTSGIFPVRPKRTLTGGLAYISDCCTAAPSGKLCSNHAQSKVVKIDNTLPDDGAVTSARSLLECMVKCRSSPTTCASAQFDKKSRTCRLLPYLVDPRLKNPRKLKPFVTVSAYFFVNDLMKLNPCLMMMYLLITHYNYSH